MHIDGRRITLRSSFFFKLSSSGLRKEGELIYERILRQFAARERGFFFGILGFEDLEMMMN